MLCTAVRHIMEIPWTHTEFWHIWNSVYSSIFRHFQACSALLRHIEIYWGIIKVYSGFTEVYSEPLVSLAYWQTCLIPSSVMFRTGGIFKALWNFDEAYSERCHSQNKLFKHSLHKKWSFPLRISSVNVTKSAVSCGFDHIYWRNP